MKISCIKRQNFGANPSNALRNHLAQAIAEGKNVKRLLGLIKGVYPNKFMTMLEENNKVFSVGLTDVFESVAEKIKMPNPMLIEKTKLLRPANTKIQKPIIITSSQAIEHPAVSGDKVHLTNTRIDTPKFIEETKKLEKLYPPIQIIKEPRGYISLYRDAQGKPFNDIIETLTESLSEVREQQTLQQKALDIVNSIFPPYEKYATKKDILKNVNAEVPIVHRLIGTGNYS